MKITSTFAILLALGLLSSCRQNDPKDDAQILKKVLRDYFDGMKARDIKKLNAVTTNDFVLFEDGKVWTNDSVINSLGQLKSFQGNWKFDNMKVNIDQSSGDIIYYDHGDFVINDSIKASFDWIESATFRKIDGKWKMNFLHSTPKK